MGENGEFGGRIVIINIIRNIDRMNNIMLVWNGAMIARLHSDNALYWIMEFSIVFVISPSVRNEMCYGFEKERRNDERYRYVPSVLRT